ncbi:cytochrome b ascorbate-dependent protein 3 isoform X1 [Alligator sinensis]|uniref:Lysosomal membrane ascorbate-dependent ferrireductase CYB561A3 n=2 Tax=Alligator sinensis TaxID=38654 RepID=A0A3Q0GWZ1_ALLSI|nr:cytochrome b ascorbate-dependent protein 3 isoform X1 [Alligator sinensis]XP_025062697.1 cytochrome b ascorbate-dependent protein 3 isoform X1 [Alligator sinensis]XP_025062698.1 cytochrome b ascorbate-dependent protein 3 isoform X1 [Alligator sinensis]
MFRPPPTRRISEMSWEPGVWDVLSNCCWAGVVSFSGTMPTLRFLPFSILLGVVGILCVGLTGFWCYHWRGGFGWDGTARMFNWHPVFMVTGMVVLYGAAALVYRLPLSRRGSKLPWKLLHAALALVAFLLAVLGLVAVFSYHKTRTIANMYSLHSWVGLTAVVLFSCQWLMGFSTFLLPWAPTWLRGLYKPIHVFFGCAIFMLAIAASISGINEKLFFSLNNATVLYSSLPPEAWFANTLGLLIVVLGWMVLWALSKPAWKRPELDSPEAQQPLLEEDK